MLEEYRITKCVPKKDYSIELTFEDGKSGIVSLDHLVGKGVFSLWSDYNEFEKASVDHTSKTVCWGDSIDLDPIKLREKIDKQENSSRH